MHPRISVKTDKGPRNYQEDTFVTRPIDVRDFKGTLLAVADGHDGKATSNYVAHQICNDLFELMLVGEKIQAAP